MGTVFDAGVAVAAQALGARVHNVAGVAIIQPDARAHASSNLRVGEGSLLTDYHHAELASSPRPNKEAATSRLEVRLVEAASQPVGYAELFYYTWSVILAGFWSLAMTFQHVTVYHHMAKQMPTVGARLRLKASLELYRHVVRAASAVTIVAGMARKKFFESLSACRHAEAAPAYLSAPPCGPATSFTLPGSAFPTAQIPRAPWTSGRSRPAVSWRKRRWAMTPWSDCTA